MNKNTKRHADDVRQFDPSAMDHFFDSIELVFDKTQGTYKNAALYDGTDITKKFTTVTDAKNADVESLIVIIEGTHDGKTENFTEYVGDKMKKSTPTWTKPYNKPILKHHDSYRGDPIGRVVKAEFGDSLTDPDSKTIFLHMEISDPDAIDKFLDGRFSTVSIGARVKELTCQICGREILKNGFCGHWLGEKYEKVSKTSEGKEKKEMVTCYWTIGECIYYEVSVVNSPADKKQTGPLQMIKKTSDGDSGGGQDSSEIDDITNFLDSEKRNDNSGEEKKTDENNADGEKPGDAGGENNPGNQDEKSSEGCDPCDRSVRCEGCDQSVRCGPCVRCDRSGHCEGAEGENSAKIAELTTQISQLITDNELLSTTNSTLQIEIEKLSDENKNLKDLNMVSVKQLSTRTEQTLKLGRQIKEIMKNTIAMLGRVKVDDVAYAEKTIVEIKKEFDEVVNRASTVIPSVDSPGLVNNNAAGVDSASEGASNKENKRKTLQDYANAIIENKPKDKE
jgi:hypothetical protein